MILYRVLKRFQFQDGDVWISIFSTNIPRHAELEIENFLEQLEKRINDDPRYHRGNEAITQLKITKETDRVEPESGTWL